MTDDTSADGREVKDASSTTEKGDRAEREARDIIGRVRGTGNVEKVDAFANTDPFGCVDVLAVGAGRKVLFVQVKVNRFTAADRRKYKRRMRRLPFNHVTFEVWVRVDYEGWRMHRYDPGSEEFRSYLEMDSCDYEATVEAYRGECDTTEEDRNGIETAKGDSRI